MKTILFILAIVLIIILPASIFGTIGAILYSPTLLLVFSAVYLKIEEYKEDRAFYKRFNI